MIKKLLLSVIAMLSIATVSAQTYYPSQYGYDENDCRYILHEEDKTAELVAVNAQNNITNDIFKKTITDNNGIVYNVTTISGELIWTGQDGVKHYRGAFESKSFKDNKLVIPDWITTITNAAFQTANLESVTFGSGLETIGDYAFNGCTKLNEIKFFTNKDASENEKLKSIGKYAFSQAGDNSTGLKITFPGSIQHIWDYAFHNSKVTHLCFAKDSQEREDLNVHTDAFDLCEDLTTLELYCSIVGEESFQNCQYLKKLIIGKGVEKICKRAFYDTQSLETIIIGCTTPPICEEDAFLGAGYASSQKETDGYYTDENGEKIYMGTEEAKGKYHNSLYYVNVKFAVTNAEAVMAKYKNSRVTYKNEDNQDIYNYQGWEKCRTNNFFIEFTPNEDGTFDTTPDQTLLANFGNNRMHVANFYYSPITYEEVKNDPDISDPDEIQIIDYVTGIENVTTDKDAASAAKVYATTGAINVVAEEGTPVAVYSITGAQVYNGYNNTISVNPGLYIVRVADKSTKVIVK